MDSLRTKTVRAPTTRAPTTRAPTTRAPTTRAPTTRAPTTVALDNALKLIVEENTSVEKSIVKKDNSNTYIYTIENKSSNNQDTSEPLPITIQFQKSNSFFHNKIYNIPGEISYLLFNYNSDNDYINDITYYLNYGEQSYTLNTLDELEGIKSASIFTSPALTIGAPTPEGLPLGDAFPLEVPSSYLEGDFPLEVSYPDLDDDFPLEVPSSYLEGDFPLEVPYPDLDDDFPLEVPSSYLEGDFPLEVPYPYLDDDFPSDIRIHQGGTYNIILSMNNYENIHPHYEDAVTLKEHMPHFTIEMDSENRYPAFNIIGEIYNLNTHDSLPLDYYEIHQNGFISLYLEKGNYTYIPYSPANGIAIYDSTLDNIYQHNLIEENIILFKYNLFEHYVIEGEFVDCQNNSNNEIYIIYANGITEIHKLSMTFENYFEIYIQTKSPIKEIKFKGSSKIYAKIYNEINYYMNEYNGDFFIGTFELNNNEKNTINTENYIFNNTLVSLELHNNIDKHNLTQVKYYEKEALIDGKYNILPEYYLSYKLELELYKKIKQNLELPENYEDLNTFNIITNILKYTKIVTDKNNENTIDTLISNLVSLDDNSGFLNKMRSIVSFEDNKDLYNECYNNVKTILNPYEIGRIICLITKNEGYITNEIKKVLIDYFLSVKNNILKLMDEVLIYSVIFIQHYLYILNNNIEPTPTSTPIDMLLAEIGKLCKQTDESLKRNQIDKISELLNHFKIPKKFIIYITIFIEIFITFIFGKIDTISDLLKIKDTIIHVFLTMGVNENTNNGSLIITDEIFSFMSTVLASEYAENYNNSHFEKFQDTSNNTESLTTSLIVLNTDAMKNNMFYMLFIIIIIILDIQFLSNTNYSELYDRISKENKIDIIDIDNNNEDILADLFCYFIDFISYQENHLPTTTSFVTTAAPK